MIPVISPNPSTITVPTQKVIWRIVARNNGEVGVLSGVKVQLTFSSAVIIHRVSSSDNLFALSQGDISAQGTFFDTSTKLWTVGSLAVGEANKKVLFVETSLASGTDLSAVLPLTLTQVISATGITDSQIGNNTKIDTLLSPFVDIPCAPVAGGQNGECLCSVADNDTPCNYGVTKWEPIVGQYVNVDPLRLHFDINTGRYSDDALIDPTEDGTFQYMMRCYDENGIVIGGPFGPITQTIRALFPISGLDLGLAVDGDLETLNLKKGSTVLMAVDICDIVDTCSALDGNDLQD
jgi:hypothetical protein